MANSMMETSVLILGAITMAAGGFALALALLGLCSWGVGLALSQLFTRMRRTYHLAVIYYWLDRLEKGGWRVFQKAEQEERAKAAGGEQ